jgi:hypothetical protein
MFTPTNHGFSADLMKTVRDILEEGVPKTSAGATEAKVVQAVGQIKHFAKEMYKGDIKKAYNDWASKTTFGPALKADVLKRAGGVNEATDPVDKKELTKSFEKRKDKDIDNDGDTDSSDEYLHKRRKAISNAMKEELDVDEGFINLGGAKVKDDEKSILQHIKKTFPNVKKVKKDSQHGWIPVFEAKMPNGMLTQLKKAYEPMRDKKISMDNAKKLTAIMNKFGDDKDILIQLMKADIPLVSQGAVTRLISKHSMKGAELNKMMKEESDVDEEVSMEFETIDDIQEASSETIANLRERLKQARAKMDAATGHSAMVQAMNVVESLNKQLKNATMSEGKEDKSVKETEAEKNDEDGDGKKDKKKNKKNGDKVETIDTKPSVDSNTMVQTESVDLLERAAKGLSASEKEKLGQLKSKFENGKMHRTLRKQYGDKGDDIFYGKLTKMAKGEYNGADSKNEELEFTSEDFNSLEELAAIGRGEDLNEISKDLAKHYINTADMDMEFRDDDITRTARSGQSTRDLRRKNSKRLTKTYLAKAKLGQHDSRKARVSATEELELTELSKKTLGSYVKKASHDVATNAAATGRYADRANKLSDEMKASGDYSKEMERRKNNKVADKAFDKSWKRRGGIAKAVDKMTVEEVYIDGELTEAMGSVTIDSEGHRLHGKKGSIFHKHADGRINVQVKTGPRKGDVNNLTLKPGEFKTVKEDLALEEEAKRRGRPPKGDDADDSADRNFVMQMRKAVSLRGQYDTVFDDGTKKKTSAEAGQNFLNKYNALTRPAQKELFMKSASKSPKHFAMALQGKVEKPKNYLALPGLKSDKLDK